jgi:hypothetical protein
MMADPLIDSSGKPTPEQVAEQLCIMLNLEADLRSIAMAILSLPPDDHRLKRLSELVCRQGGPLGSGQSPSVRARSD